MTNRKIEYWVIPPESDAEFVASMEEVLDIYARPYDPDCPRILEGRYADCKKVILVCDNLNTHTKGAFYEAFDPERVRQLVRRIEFRHTPKHSSWLNIAENELSSLTRQCVSGRRFGDTAVLVKETSAWCTDVNNTQRGVEWQMKVDDARTKLKSVYPKIKT